MIQLDEADCRKLCKSGGGAQPKVLVVGWAVAEWWWPGAGQSAGHCFPSILHLMAHGQTRPEMADSDITHSHTTLKIYTKSFYCGSNLIL